MRKCGFEESICCEWAKFHLHGHDVGLDAGTQDGGGSGGALRGVRRGVGRHDELDEPPEEPQVGHANLVEEGGVGGRVSYRVGLNAGAEPRGLLVLLQIGHGSES